MDRSTLASIVGAVGLLLVVVGIAMTVSGGAAVLASGGVLVALSYLHGGDR